MAPVCSLLKSGDNCLIRSRIAVSVYPSKINFNFQNRLESTRNCPKRLLQIRTKTSKAPRESRAIQLTGDALTSSTE